MDAATTATTTRRPAPLASTAQGDRISLSVPPTLLNAVGEGRLGPLRCQDGGSGCVLGPKLRSSGAK